MKPTLEELKEEEMQILGMLDELMLNLDRTRGEVLHKLNEINERFFRELSETSSETSSEKLSPDRFYAFLDEFSGMDMIELRRLAQNFGVDYHGSKETIIRRILERTE